MREYKELNKLLSKPYGKNKWCRNLRWAWQRFRYGWDETMPDNLETWLFEFMQVACMESAKHKVAFGWNEKDDVPETPMWHKENMQHGAKLFRNAYLATWNDYKALGLLRPSPKNFDTNDAFMEAYAASEAHIETYKREALEWLKNNIQYFEYW